MRGAKLVLVIGAGVVLSGVAAQAVLAEDYGPFKEQKTKLGNLLVSPTGMTLYTFDKDTPGVSTCTGSCAEHWPPAAATAADKPAGDLTIIKRPDSSLQWADSGKPLYLYQDDHKPGDVTGDGKGGVWHVVKEQ